MKKSLVMATLVAASTSMMAMNIEPFIGLDFIKGKVDTQEGGSGTAVIGGVVYTGAEINDETIRDNTFGVKAGVIIEKNHRIYVNYFKLKDTVYDNKVSYQLPSINYDYLIINDKLHGFTPYIGVHAGYGKTDFGDYLGKEFENKSSFDYGLNLGLIKDITENISFEFGYKYTKVDQDSTIGPGTFTNADGDTFTGKAYQENKDVQTFAFGINYKF